MFDVGWSELLIIGVVALIVVGPKDLPKMFRTLGQLMGKARGMAREFTRAMEAAADDAGVKDVAKTFRDTTSGKSLREAAGFDEIEKEFRDIGRDPLASRGGGKPVPAAQPVSGPVGKGDKDRAAGPVPDPGAPEAPADAAAANAAFNQTEAERLKRAARAAESRRRAAEIRARDAAVATETPPAAAPPADDRQS